MSTPLPRIAHLSTLLMLAACPQEEEPAPPPTDPPAGDQAVFAEGTDDALVSAAAAAAGYLPAIAWSATVPAMIDSAVSNNECPTVSEGADGAVTYAASECTGPSGQTYDGSFVGENLPDLFGSEPNHDPMSSVFDGWSVDDLRVDGTLWQSEAMPTGDYTLDADLAVTIPDLPEASATLSLDCALDASMASTCQSVEPASFAVDGLGTFTVAGPWSMGADGLPTGELALVGADTLVLDLDGMDPVTGCIPASIGGQPIDDICIGGLIGGPSEPPPGPGEEVSVMGSALTFGEELEVTLWTLGAVASVEAELVVDGSDPELHPVAFVGPNPRDEDTWSLFLSEGQYVPGESTALEPYSNMYDIAVKLRAYDAQDNVVGCAFAGTVHGDPVDYFGWDECPGTW